MGQEIEAKIRVQSLEGVRERLRTYNAVHRGDQIELDTLFDDDGRTLRARGVALRLRAIQAIHDERMTHVLTVKGPVQSSSFKKREEIEMNVTDAPNAERMLGLLGFTPVLSYQKRRSCWSVGDCVVSLDEPARLGLFVEIEGTSEAAIRAVRSQLNLEECPQERSSYPAMIHAYCERFGIEPKVVRLESPAH